MIWLRFLSLFSGWLRPSQGERGQTLVEYALIIALLSMALVGTLTTFGGGVDGLYGVIQRAVDALMGS